jgi:catechol 2,3-dioxygenase-like lactoylglutathione lyase family enzyme
MISLTHLRHIALRVRDLDRARHFYETVWGLDPVAEGPGQVYFRGAGDEHHILALIQSDRPGIHHIAFGLRDRREVEVAAAELRERGLRIVYGPGPLEEPGGGYGLRFVDPEGRCIEFSCWVELHTSEWRSKNVDPVVLNHIVLNTTDIDKMCEFYTTVMNFRVSDWSEHQMVFLRCNKRHHSIAFNQAPHASLNHVAYEVSGVDEVMRGLANLREHGIEPLWGPGRHGPGNNIFCYFRDPEGFVIEYTSDLLTLEDEENYQARVWRRIKPLMDRWGIAGPPTVETRRAMLGDADPGWYTGSST